MTRRTTLGMLLAMPAGAAPPPPQETLSARVCLFTDHLAGFSYEDVARMLSALGVSGPDLTVRPGGLVAPQRVADELPKAQAAFAARNLRVPMITTAITSARDPLARAVLETASRLGIGYYKLGYFKYEDLAQWRRTLDETRSALTELAQLNQRLNLRAGMHNHAGDAVGCGLWDSWEAMQAADASRVGFYFDPAQATIEGGKTAWNLNFRRIAPRLFMLAIKDFVWGANRARRVAHALGPAWRRHGELARLLRAAQGHAVSRTHLAAH